MEWDEKLATNIKIMDKEHKEVVRRLNDVLLAKQHKNRSKYLKLTLKLLYEYCATHFSSEENLQLKSNYPNYKEHKRHHVNFLKKVKELGEQPITDNLIITIENVAGEWLVKHIDGVDKLVAKHILESKT